MSYPGPPPFGVPFAVMVLVLVWACLPGPKGVNTNPAIKAEQERLGYDARIDSHARKMLEEGREIFRYDSFGSEDFCRGWHKQEGRACRARPDPTVKGEAEVLLGGGSGRLGRRRGRGAFRLLPAGEATELTVPELAPEGLHVRPAMCIDYVDAWIMSRAGIDILSLTQYPAA